MPPGTLVTTDTAALLATVREVLRYWPDTADGTRAEAALDSLAAELERLRDPRRVGQSLSEADWERASALAVHWKGVAEAAEAELERVKAERDELEDWIRHHKAVADTALSALREIRDMRGTPEARTGRFYDVARVALAEIEGEA